MAKKRTYTVQTPTGPVTRTTARTYSHVIIAKSSEQYALNEINKPSVAKSDADQWTYEYESANGDDHGLFTKKNDYGFGPGREEEYKEYRIKARAEYHAQAQAWIAAAPTKEGWVAKRKADRMDRFNKRKAAGDFDNFGGVSWCGRADLAAKELAKHESSPWLTDVAVLEVPQV